MDEKERVRVGLALSGGGFRATLFHLGVVRLLYESGYLGGSGQAGRKGIVQRVGAVSGGSVIAAHLALNWSRYTAEPNKFEEGGKRVNRFCSKGH
ncbi:putative acylesterase/phospholipase RssA [Bradyrhizobium sp. LM6.10]